MIGTNADGSIDDAQGSDQVSEKKSFRKTFLALNVTH